jgi:hypothetical protein
MQVPTERIFHHKEIFVLCSGFEPLCISHGGESTDIFPMKTQHRRGTALQHCSLKRPQSPRNEEKKAQNPLRGERRVC